MNSVPEKRNSTIEISLKTVLYIIGIIILLQLLLRIKVIVLQLFVAIILMSALNPVVNRLMHVNFFGKKLPRISAIVLAYLMLFVFFSAFVTYIAQPLTEQTLNLINQIPQLVEFAGGWGINDQVLMQQLSQFGSISANIFWFIGSVFSNVFTVFTTLVMSFYLLLEREHLHEHLGSFFSNPSLERRIERFIYRIEIEMGGWVRAQVILMCIVGALNFVGFTLLGIDYALALALIAGLMEIIPNVGPTIASIPAAVAGFGISPFHGIAVVAWAIIVQQIENNILVPQIMAKNTGVNPLVTILALLVGFNLAGVAGAILAVPTIIIVKATLKEFFSDRLPGHPSTEDLAHVHQIPSEHVEIKTSKVVKNGGSDKPDSVPQRE